MMETYDLSSGTTVRLVGSSLEYRVVDFRDRSGVYLLERGGDEYLAMRSNVEVVDEQAAGD